MRSLVVDTIRRALAAIVGGSEEPPAVPAKEPPAATAADEAPDEELAALESRSPPAPLEPGAESPAASGGAAGDARSAPPPTFDIVRVERDGRAVIAGRAAPGADVEIKAGDRVLERVRANRRGEWVASPLVPLEHGEQELTLVVALASGELIESEQVVVVALPEPPPPQPAPIAAAEAPPPQPAPVALAEAPPPQPAAVASETAPGGPVAVLLPRSGRGAGRILQAPGRISGDGQLALMILDYDETGRIELSGEAPSGAPLRVYVDNERAADLIVTPSGQWTAKLDRTLAPGTYTLRLDQLDAAGKPVARLETPFTRVEQPPVEGNVEVDYVVVQPGNSLWRISRRLFGRGISYVYIYEANKAQIRDPDLIYPGQVFEIPEGLSSAG